MHWILLHPRPAAPSTDYGPSPATALGQTSTTSDDPTGQPGVKMTNTKVPSRLGNLRRAWNCLKPD